MGQAFGKPAVAETVKQFVNLPKEAVQSVWTSFNLHGEGWGLELFDFKIIFSEAAYFMSLGFTDEQLEALFNAFDTDGNGLVDALELIISLVLSSGALIQSFIHGVDLV
jgi:Ca2+-binding EF-hand superfamily protein